MQPGGQEFRYWSALSPDIDDFIFGLDWLTDMNVTWNIAAGIILFQGVEIPVYPHFGYPQVRRIVSAQTVIIPPLHEVDIMVSIPFHHLNDRVPALCTDSKEIAAGVHLPGSVLRGNVATGILKVLNNSLKPYEISQGTELTEGVPYISTALDQYLQQTVDGPPNMPWGSVPAKQSSAWQKRRESPGPSSNLS